MISTLAMIREKYGGPVGYMKEKCDLGGQDIERIKENILEDGTS